MGRAAGCPGSAAASSEQGRVHPSRVLLPRCSAVFMCQQPQLIHLIPISISWDCSGGGGCALSHPKAPMAAGCCCGKGAKGIACTSPPPPHQKRTAGQRDAAGDVLLGQKVTAVRINGNRQHLRKKSPSHVPNAKQRGSSGASELCVPTRQSHEVGTGAGLCVAPCRRGRGGP